MFWWRDAIVQRCGSTAAWDPVRVILGTAISKRLKILIFVLPSVVYTSDIMLKQHTILNLQIAFLAGLALVNFTAPS